MLLHQQQVDENYFFIFKIEENIKSLLEPIVGNSSSFCDIQSIYRFLK